MANINKGRLFLKLAAHALLKALKKTPVLGAVIEIGADCWKILRDEQEQCAIEERIAQLEQAAARTPAEVVQEATALGGKYLQHSALAWAVKFCQDEVSANLLILEKKNLTLLIRHGPCA